MVFSHSRYTADLKSAIEHVAQLLIISGLVSADR
jgi:hypothetical protein